MKKTFFKTVRFYSLIIVGIGALIAFVPFALSGFNLSFIAHNKKIVKEDNEQKIYTCDLAGISSININTNNTNVNIVPSKSSEFKVTYVENADEKYNILKTQNGISVTYKNNNPQKGNLLQRIPIFKGGSSSKYENNDLTIAIPEFYSGDIDFVSKKGELYNDEPFLFNGPFKINGLKNINNLNIDFSDLVSIENVTCKNNINIKTERDCNLTNIFSENSIKIDTVVGEINLDNVSSKNILDANSVDGPINISKVSSDRICLASPLKISGTVYGKESDYVIDKQNRKNSYTTLDKSNTQNLENKKILILSSDSDVKFVA